MTAQYLDFGSYHGKRDVQGSTFIRMVQMQKHWPEFTKYKYGAKPHALIFQKVYCTEDYKFPAHYPGITILDICDPDWLEGVNIVETCHAVDAVVTPTQALADYIKQFHTNVTVIKDRFDLKQLPKPKVHKGAAKTVVWFGYSHNAELMKSAMPTIDRLGLNLIIIANDEPFVHQWSKRDHKDYYTFIKYNEETIYQDLQRADIAVLPEGNRPQDVFKSDNKTIKANLAGLPVAKNADDLEKYMQDKARKEWFDTNYAKIKSDYDIRLSVKEYQELINELTT